MLFFIKYFLEISLSKIWKSVKDHNKKQAA